MKLTPPSCIYGRTTHRYSHYATKGGDNRTICTLCYYIPHRPPKTKPRTQRPKSLKKAAIKLLDHFEDVCVYCGVKLTCKTRSVDHVIPRSRGGSDTISNYLLACQDCNNDKADQTVSEWLGIQGPPPFLIPREKVRGETAPGTAYIERMKEASDE